MKLNETFQVCNILTIKLLHLKLGKSILRNYLSPEKEDLKKKKEFCEVDYKTLRNVENEAWEVKDKNGNWRKIFTFSPVKNNLDSFWIKQESDFNPLMWCIDGEVEENDEYVYEMPQFSEGLLPILRTWADSLGITNSCSGFINVNGEEVIPCMFGHVAGPQEGYVWVRDVKGFSGYLLDLKGRKVLQTRYDSVTLPSKGLLSCSDSNNEDLKTYHNIIDLEENIVFPNGRHVEHIVDNLYIVDCAYLIDKTGKIIKSAERIQYLGSMPIPLVLINSEIDGCYVYNLVFWQFNFSY